MHLNNLIMTATTTVAIVTMVIILSRENEFTNQLNGHKENKIGAVRMKKLLVLRYSIMMIKNIMFTSLTISVFIDKIMLLVFSSGVHSLLFVEKHLEVLSKSLLKFSKGAK